MAFALLFASCKADIEHKKRMQKYQEMNQRALEVGRKLDSLQSRLQKDRVDWKIKIDSLNERRGIQL